MSDYFGRNQTKSQSLPSLYKLPSIIIEGIILNDYENLHCSISHVGEGRLQHQQKVLVLLVLRVLLVLLVLFRLAKLVYDNAGEARWWNYDLDIC